MLYVPLRENVPGDKGSLSHCLSAQKGAQTTLKGTKDEVAARVERLKAVLSVDPWYFIQPER